MTFKKGHKLSPGGKRERSGRKKSPAKALKESLDRATQELPELLDIYVEVCKDGKHVELFEYICDRVLGKPGIKADINLEGGAELGKGTFLEIIRMINEARRELETQHIVEERPLQIKEPQDIED